MKPSVWYESDQPRDEFGFAGPSVRRARPRCALPARRAQSLYVTMFPCNECSKLLIQAGIREVVFYEDKQANAEAPGVSAAGAAGAGGMAPSEAYAASRTLLGLAGVAVRQHAPATALVLQVAPLAAAE